MKIVLENEPAKIQIVTPHGTVDISLWPVSHTEVTVSPSLDHSDYCARGDNNTKITLKPRA